MAEKIFRLYTDGACRGNPGSGGAGVLLTDKEGNTVATVKRYLGDCTNNIAEYQALILGLEEALACGCRKLQIFADSELLVRQVKGLYRVKNANLMDLMGRVRVLLSRFEGYEIEHVPRGMNTQADRLANEAIDESLEKWEASEQLR
jgi:ribonuclease HI